MNTYNTLSEAINDLVKKGYTRNFNLKPDCIVCSTTQLNLQPHEFEIDEIFRFEGMNDPGDSDILYAISSRDHDIKGLLVNAYGVYADNVSAKIAEKLKVHTDH